MMTIGETAIDQGLNLLVVLTKFQLVSGRFRTTFGKTAAANEMMLVLLRELRDIVAAIMQFTLTDEHICHIKELMDEVDQELRKPPAVKIISTVN